MLVISGPSDFVISIETAKLAMLTMPINRFNHSSWVAVITSTDRPKSVHNHCVVEVSSCIFVLLLCMLGFSVGVRAFVLGLSQISSFSSCIVYTVTNVPTYCIFNNVLGQYMQTNVDKMVL